LILVKQLNLLDKKIKANLWVGEFFLPKGLLLFCLGLAKQALFSGGEIVV
jgi:hypothetical protein